MSDTKIREPAPNWCRTCGRRPNDPMAALCPDTHHRSLERLHPQPAELAEQQWIHHPQTVMAKAQWDAVADALGADRDCPDAVLAAALAATGKQKVGESCTHEWRTAGGGSQARRPLVCSKCNQHRDHMPQQVGEVQGDVLDAVVDAICYDQHGIQVANVSAVLRERIRRALAARQPVYDSPMAKMAAALRTKAADEQADFNRRVQSGEWGPMPDAGTQADFCKNCDGSGWDGQSRETVCPTCSGGGIAARQPGASNQVVEKIEQLAVDSPPAQGIALGPVRELLRRRMAQWRSHLPSDPGAPGTVAISGDGEGGYNNDVRMYREGIAVMDEVLALIDQREVGDE